MNFLKNGTG